MPIRSGAPASDDILARRTYAVILTGVFLWNGTLALAPLLAAAGWSGMAEYLYAFFHRICHQLDGRSLHIAGEPLAVCVRCTAIYCGFLAGTVAYPLLRRVSDLRIPARGLLVVAVVPMVLDVILGLAGVHEATTLTRVITGFIAGVILPSFILPAAVGAVQQLASRRRHATTTSITEGLSDA